MWLLSFEAFASLLWVVTFVATLIIAAFELTIGGREVFGVALAWRIAIT